MSADVSLSVLDRIRVASPCSVRWEEMNGDERTRHCSQCNLNVHNLSAMGREEAEALVSSHFAPGGSRVGQRLCANWRRRTDRTIIFGDCPVGAAKLRKRVWRSVARVAAVAGFSSLLAACSQRSGGVVSTGGRVVQTGGSVSADDEGEPVMPGEVSAPTPAQETP